MTRLEVHKRLSMMLKTTSTILMLSMMINGGSTRGVNQDDLIHEVVHTRRRMQTETYCVASSGADATALQAALDWACGPQGGVDCSVLQSGAACYDPNTVSAHASYAMDAYYVKENGAPNSCNFNGVATITTTNPSSGACNYPALSSTTSTTPTTPTTTSPNTSYPPPPPTYSNNTFSPVTSNATYSPDNTTSGTTSGVTLSTIPYPISHLLFGSIVIVALTFN